MGTLHAQENLRKDIDAQGPKTVLEFKMSESSDSSDTIPYNPDDLIEDSDYGVYIDLSGDDMKPTVDAWDDWHVKLPCSPKNCVQESHKWNLICQNLSQKFSSTAQLEAAILSYNPQQSNLLCLRYFFQQVSKEESDVFFQETLPFILRLALSLPDLVRKPIPLLLGGIEQEILLSQHQIACLLANMFLCTFPTRPSKGFPSVNFEKIFASPCEKRKVEKLRCILHYFRRLSTAIPLGSVSFKRQVIDEFPDWENCKLPLRKLFVNSQGSIEDSGYGMLQVDFANKIIGGGVIGSGCVQEEIRFVINPECIVSRLFTLELKPNEALIIKGSERFSSYSGYSHTFEWTGDYIDNTPRDRLGRIKTNIVAMDALKVYKSTSQYSKKSIRRELEKAYAGFFEEKKNQDQLLSPLATGNWGCGAFGGCKQLKSLVQLIAATVAGITTCWT
eukprot:TRINITY_DN3793_c0_g4_i5.p1 TRINITY_DN3793_c0_g4~~TRINITY_DN3793_c0_g4_i5.p1  ORF type:complete len:446 (-),score=94.35 TRINITY_DN3793_c0_g4_i5:283-1620(-)